MLILSFDTATPVASVALVRDRELLGENACTAARVLVEADRILRLAGLAPAEIEALTVGTGPGSFTGLRVGLALARGLAFALALPVSGVSTLDTLAAGAPGALPLVDARRKEVFALLEDGPAVLRPEALDLPRGTACVGDGAVRYRALLEAAGLQIPPDGEDVHRPRAHLHSLIAGDFGAADAIQPLYLRLPDADQARAA